MEANDIVGKCKHCGDPIYRFQAVAHEGCVREYEFNPDYLDFQKGVEAGRTVGKQAGIEEVVDFILNHRWQGHKSVGFDVPKGFLINEKELQAQLKDWEI